MTPYSVQSSTWFFQASTWGATVGAQKHGPRFGAGDFHFRFVKLPLDVILDLLHGLDFGLHQLDVHGQATECFSFYFSQGVNSNSQQLALRLKCGNGRLEGFGGRARAMSLRVATQLARAHFRPVGYAISRLQTG